MAREIERFYTDSPDTANAVKGDTGPSGLEYVRTGDLGGHELLRAILVELKKMNVHLTSVSGEEVSDNDI